MNGYIIIILILLVVCVIFGYGFFHWLYLLDETQDKYLEKVLEVGDLQKKLKSLTEPIRIETYTTEPVCINLSFEEAILEHEDIYTMTGRINNPLSFTTVYNFQTRFIPYVTGEERFK